MSSSKKVVMRSLDETGTKLRQLADMLSDEEFFEEPQYGSSMAWTLMHLMHLEDWTIKRVILGNEPTIGHIERDAFKGGRPVIDSHRSLYPSCRELEAKFSATRERTLLVPAEFDNSRWDDATPTDCRFPTLGTVWVRIPIYSGHLFRQITGRLNTAVLVRPVDLWTRRYRYNSAWLLTMVALPTSPQAQHQSKWPDLNRNRWPVLSESAVWESLSNDCWWHLGQLSVSVTRFRGTTLTVGRPRYHSTDFHDVKQKLSE